MVADRDRHPGAEVLQEARCSRGCRERGRRGCRRSQWRFRVDGWHGNRHGYGDRNGYRCRGGHGRRHQGRNRCPPGVPPAGIHLDRLGQEVQVLLHGGGRAGLLRRDVLHPGPADGRTELAPVVQHGPVRRLRPEGARPGSLLRQSRHRRSGKGDQRLRAPAAACVPALPGARFDPVRASCDRFDRRGRPHRP